MPDSDLGKLQAAFADVVSGKGIDATLAKAIVSDTLSADQRLAIHANTYSQSLIAALEGVFPLVGVLVGQDFMKQALTRFVQANPPEAPMLYIYGAAFPDFLAAQEPLQGMGFVADMARLEWHTHALMHAVEAAPEPGAGIVWNPNAKLVPSEFRLFDLWRAATGQIAPEDVPASGAGQAVLVLLHEGQIHYQPVEEPEVWAAMTAFAHGAGPTEQDSGILQELIDRGAIWPASQDAGV